MQLAWTRNIWFGCHDKLHFETKWPKENLLHRTLQRDDNVLCPLVNPTWIQWQVSFTCEFGSRCLHQKCQSSTYEADFRKRFLSRLSGIIHFFVIMFNSLTWSFQYFYILSFLIHINTFFCKNKNFMFRYLPELPGRYTFLASLLCQCL